MFTMPAHECVCTQCTFHEYSAVLTKNQFMLSTAGVGSLFLCPYKSSDFQVYALSKAHRYITCWHLVLRGMLGACTFYKFAGRCAFSLWKKTISAFRSDARGHFRGHGMKYLFHRRLQTQVNCIAALTARVYHGPASSLKTSFYKLQPCFY